MNKPAIAVLIVAVVSFSVAGGIAHAQSGYVGSFDLGSAVYNFFAGLFSFGSAQQPAVQPLVPENDFADTPKPDQHALPGYEAEFLGDLNSEYASVDEESGIISDTSEFEYDVAVESSANSGVYGVNLL